MSGEPSRGWNPWFAAGAALSVLLSCLLLPSLTVRPEVWNEAGTNFFLVARYGDLWTNLRTPDAGYLPWMQRLVAVVLVKGLGVVRFYPHAIQAVATLAIALLASLINLRAFRKVLPSDPVRFLLGLHFALAPSYELHAFINASYFGVLFALWAILLDKERLPAAAFAALSLTTAVFCLSKGYFAALGPVFLVLLLRGLRAGRRREAAFAAAGLAAVALQSVVMLGNLPHHTHPEPLAEKLSDLGGVAGSLLYYWFYTFSNVVTQSSLRDTPTTAALLTFVAAAAVGVSAWGILRLRARGRDDALFFVGLCHLGLLSALGLTVLAFSRFTSAAWGHVPGWMPFNRRFFFGHSLLTLALASTALNAWDGPWPKRALTAWLVFMNLGFCLYKLQERYPTAAGSPSQWSRYAALAEREAYCIPINPYTIVVGRGCGVLARAETGPEGSAEVSPDWELLGVLADDRRLRLPGGARIPAVAADGTVLGRARSLAPPGARYPYFVFDPPVRGARSLRAPGGTELVPLGRPI